MGAVVGSYGVILGLSGWMLTLSWTAEVLLGVSGIALAGSEFAQAVKQHGWQAAQHVAAWRTLRTGNAAVHADQQSCTSPRPRIARK